MRGIIIYGINDTRVKRFEDSSSLLVRGWKHLYMKDYPFFREKEENIYER